MVSRPELLRRRLAWLQSPPSMEQHGRLVQLQAECQQKVLQVSQLKASCQDLNRMVQRNMEEVWKLRDENVRLLLEIRQAGLLKRVPERFESIGQSDVTSDLLLALLFPDWSPPSSAPPSAQPAQGRTRLGSEQHSSEKQEDDEQRVAEEWWNAAVQGQEAAWPSPQLPEQGARKKRRRRHGKGRGGRGSGATRAGVPRTAYLGLADGNNSFGGSAPEADRRSSSLFRSELGAAPEGYGVADEVSIEVIEMVGAAVKSFPAAASAA